METTSSNVTKWLHEWSHGDAAARDRLASAVYDRLRQIARRSLQQERRGHTLEPTELVHEAYAQLLGADVDYRDRQHFYAIAARMMRRILVNHAVAKQRAKRGGGQLPIALDQPDAIPVLDNLRAPITDLDEALRELEQFAPRQCQAIELRYFVGLSTEETAEALGVSLATLHRDLRVAKAWLYRRLSGTGGGTM